MVFIVYGTSVSITIIHIKNAFFKPEMKYAHLADLHLGSWRDPRLRELSTQAFLMAIDQCIKQEVDFILFAGDIFNTSLPSVDTLKVVTKKLKELHDKNIPVYTIAGSHDFSPSGKTMIEVLENAGLLKNVCKGQVHPETRQLQLHFTVDAKTGAKITGLLGRKGQLDQIYYQNLERESLEQEPGYKIFLFHTTIAELRPPDMEKIEAQPVSFLPQGFKYYAGGHIHHPTQVELPGYGTLTYPGALFPNNFAEIEKYHHGGYYLMETNSDHQILTWIPTKVINHEALTIDAHHKTPEQVLQMIGEHFEGKDLQQTIVTLRLTGTLEKGRVTDLNYREILEKLYAQGAYIVMKNTSQLSSAEFEEIKMGEMAPEDIEEALIAEHLQQIPLFSRERELHLTKALFQSLNTSKQEGETITDFQQRVNDEIQKILIKGV